MDNNDIFSYYFDHPAKQINDVIVEKNKRGDQSILNNSFFQDPAINSSGATTTSAPASSGQTNAVSAASPAAPAPSNKDSNAPPLATPVVPAIAQPPKAQVIVGLTATLGTDGKVSIREGAAMFNDGSIVIFSQGTNMSLSELNSRSEVAPGATGGLQEWMSYNLSSYGYVDNTTNYKLDVSVSKDGMQVKAGTEDGATYLWLHTIIAHKGLSLAPFMLHDRRGKLATLSDVYNHDRLGAFKMDAIPAAQRAPLPATIEELKAYDTANGTSFYPLADADYPLKVYAHRELFERKLEEYRNEFVRFSWDGDTGLAGNTPGLAFGQGIKGERIAATSLGPGTYDTLKLSIDFLSKASPGDPDRDGTITGSFAGTTNTATIGLPAHLNGKKVVFTMTSNTTGRAVSLTFNGPDVTLTASKEYDVTTGSHSHPYDNNGTPGTTGASPNLVTGITEKAISGSCIFEWVLLN